MVYQRNNPVFVGTVSGASLVAQGYQFSGAFLASASNAITATGITGRVITCHAALTPGALRAASEATENDASLGLAAGSTWTSVGVGSTVSLLATPVPNGNVVSVIQIGS